VEINDQQWQRLLVACRGQPSGGIDKADPVNVHLLTLRRLGHYQAYQVVDQCEDDELFEDPVDRFALQHIEAHGGFQMGEIRFNAPPGPIELGECFDGVEYRIEEGGDEGNLRDTKAFSVHPVLQFSDLKALGQVPKLLLVHPLRTGEGFKPLDELVLFPELLEPA